MTRRSHPGASGTDVPVGRAARARTVTGMKSNPHRSALLAMVGILLLAGPPAYAVGVLGSSSAAGLPSAALSTDPPDERFPDPHLTVTGLARVGATLTATHDAFEHPAVLLDYEWYVEGGRTPIARGKTYQVTEADRGRQLLVMMSAQASGYVRGTWVARVPAVGAPQLAVAVGPISGSPAIGGTLRVSATVTADGAAPTEPYRTDIQWLSDGQPIPGATGATYTVTVDDAERRITARVTVSGAGYQSATATGPAVTIPLLTPTMRVKARQVQRRDIRIRVDLTTAGMPPSGVVTISRAGKPVAFGSVVRGRMTVKLFGVRPGRHVLTVQYSGSPGVAGASTDVTVRIKR